MSDRRGYRYRVTHSDGAFAETLRPGTHLVDWKYLGPAYTWTAFNRVRGLVTGTVTGVYVDKGVVRDGKYEPEKPSPAPAAP